MMALHVDCVEDNSTGIRLALYRLNTVGTHLISSHQQVPPQIKAVPYRVQFWRMRLCLISPSLSNRGGFSSIALAPSSNLSHGLRRTRLGAASLRICATADGVEAPEAAEEELRLETEKPESPFPSSSSSPSALGKDLKKVVNKTAATFAPRASTASKNPAVPGTTLYKVFEVQGYASMLVGGVLSFNLLFPSNEPDIWRLMGMWSIWMFTIPSLRARDCPSKEKEALNYLFLIIPLLNVAIPFFWKSFALVWSADTVTFFAMYAWKLGWLERTE